VVYIITVFVNYWYMSDQQKVADAHNTPIIPDRFALLIWVVLHMFLFFFVMVACVYPEGSVLSDSYYKAHVRLLVLVAFLCNIVWLVTFSFIGVDVTFVPICLFYGCVSDYFGYIDYIWEKCKILIQFNIFVVHCR
jgi:hypothetical protein